MRNKKQLEERWRFVYQTYQEDMDKMKSFYLNPRKDHFFYTRNWAGHLQNVGVLSYILDKNVNSFQQSLKESVKVRQELFEHFEQGDPVDLSYVSLQVFDSLFYALATGDIALAKEFASHLGGYPDIEPKYVLPFCIDLAYTLKFFVQRDLKLAINYLESLKKHCLAGQNYYSFRGYVIVFEAILENNVDKANMGFKELTKGHDEEWKGRGERCFKGLPEEDICLWGVGLANLCFYYGLPVEINDPLIPKDLLCTSGI